MNIRTARIEDSPALARIQVDSYRTAYAGIGVLFQAQR